MALDYLAPLASQGLLGALLIVAGFVIRKLYVDRQAESAARILDGKEYSARFEASIDKVTSAHVTAIEKATDIGNTTLSIVRILQDRSTMKPQ